MKTTFCSQVSLLQGQSQQDGLARRASESSCKGHLPLLHMIQKNVFLKKNSPFTSLHSSFCSPLHLPHMAQFYAQA
jgi:hypothetical protein